MKCISLWLETADLILNKENTLLLKLTVVILLWECCSSLGNEIAMTQWHLSVPGTKCEQFSIFWISFFLFLSCVFHESYISFYLSQTKMLSSLIQTRLMSIFLDSFVYTSCKINSLKILYVKGLFYKLIHALL